LTIKIVTDSTADISPDVAVALDITVVQSYVRFGDDVYRDGVDITSSDFFEKLSQTNLHPTTSEPTPEDFAGVYSDCSKKAEHILSIHISGRMSRICESAAKGKELANSISEIDIIDSRLVSAGLASVVMFAAKLVKAGETYESVFEKTQAALEDVQVLGIFDTTKGLVFSDRVSIGILALADIAGMMPLLTVDDGVLTRAGLVRTYSEGVEKLLRFVESDMPEVRDMVITYSVIPEQAAEFKARMGRIIPEENINMAQFGAAVGVHSGPSALMVAFRRGKQ